MSSSFGNNIKISVFGQSHSEAVGISVQGLPWGFKPDMEQLNAFMARRAPGNSSLGTSRKEKDSFEILSGLKNGILCGAPFAAVIKNTDARPEDYSGLKDIPRPGHADYTAMIKYGGFQDADGGGHFSGRLTAPLCIAGGICIQLLEKENISIISHIKNIGGISDRSFNPADPYTDDVSRLAEMELPVLDSSAGEKMAEAVLQAKSEGDSLGGIAECAVTGLPAGIGDPMFDGMENRIASAVFAIPGIKGIDFGSGFDAANMKGSENNDGFIIIDGKIVTETNNHGGILGGITTGMPLIFRAAIKPVPSIAKPQKSVSFREKSQTELCVSGRHDACIVPRALPCIEAVTAIAVYDALLDYKKYL